MLENTICAILNIIAYLMLILILQYLCCAHLRLNNRNLVICSSLGSIVICLLTFFLTNPLIFYPMFYLIYFSTILILSYKRLIDMLLSIVALLIYVAIDVVPPYILNLLPFNYHDIITIGELELSVSSVMIDVCLLFLLLSLHWFLQKYQFVLRLSAKDVLLALMLFGYSIIITVLLNLANTDDKPLWTKIVWNIILLSAFLSCIIYYVYNLAQTRLRLYHEKLIRTQTAYLTTQLDALQYLKEKEKDVQKMSHDLKKHLAVIEALCAQGHYDEVRSYSDKLNSMFLANINPISGNRIADTILASRQKKAEEHNIRFTFEGSLSNLNSLPEPDICSLLANAYDNAMEACVFQSNAYIYTKANTTKNYTSIEIRNSIPKKLKIHNNRLATTKLDKQNHGYGIEIIKQIAQRYHGYCTISSSESEFILDISLHTSKQTPER